ncbi:MAG: hypothetical protein GY696_37565 [Gammaproteobacteria bacterium]|nr:hypothetical protein [Gammaproteobacteria bacterium]
MADFDIDPLSVGGQRRADDGTGSLPFPFQSSNTIRRSPTSVANRLENVGKGQFESFEAGSGRAEGTTPEPFLDEGRNGRDMLTTPDQYLSTVPRHVP